MDNFSKYLLILLISFFINTNPVFAIESEALVPILSTILSSEDDVFTEIGPRRVNFEGGAEYSNSGNLIRRSANGTVANFDYDSLDRITDITITNLSEPSDSLRLIFTYISALDDRLRRIESTSVSSGVELNTEVNFEYSSTELLNASTNGSYEVPVFQDNQIVISTVSVDYEPSYTGDTLVRIDTRLTDDLGSPAINNVMDIFYDGSFIRQITLESSAVDSVTFNRRRNLSPFQQRVSSELIGSDGERTVTRLDTASYEEVECTDSNRLLDENLSILSLFYPLFPSTFFLPEICRD